MLELGSRADTQSETELCAYVIGSLYDKTTGTTERYAQLGG